MRHPIRPLLACLLGIAAATLVACGSSGTGLIPAHDAGPLQRDFEAVAQAAQAGDGNCAATDEALAKTEQDFAALPLTVDAGLRKTLQVGISNLSVRARGACAQPLASSTTTGATTTATSKATTTTTTSTPTTTSTTQTSSTATVTPTTTATTPAPGGGTPAPPGENDSSPGAERGQGPTPSGAGAGESGAGAPGAGGAGAGSGQGAGK